MKTQTSSFRKTRPVRATRTDGRAYKQTDTDGRTGMTRLIGVFCDYAKAPKLKGIEFM